MEINDALFSFDHCTNDPYLKCTEEGMCIECLRIENQSAKKWIDYVNDSKVVDEPVVEIPLEAV